MRLLIMEGDGQIRRLLEQLLAQKGHEVESEADGLRGWDLFHFNPGRFDSLLVNAKMPRLTGIELLRRVREKDSDLPAAVSCNYGRLERVLPALELNLRAVLPLPFQLNQLDEVLKQLTPKSPKNWKEELVLLMKTTLECWNQEGMDTTSLMQHSRIWDMKSKSAKRRYYNPELYCSADTLPRHIRWEKVVASAEFVIRNCETSLNSLALAILARQFRLNQTPPPVKSSQPSGMDSPPHETSHA